MSVRCRTCGEQIYNLNAMGLFDKDNDGILKKIEVLTGLLFTDDANMPTHICACCQLDLNHAMAFRDRCIKTQTQLIQEKQNMELGLIKSTRKNWDQLDPLKRSDFSEDSFILESDSDDEPTSTKNNAVPQKSRYSTNCTQSLDILYDVPSAKLYEKPTLKKKGLSSNAKLQQSHLKERTKSGVESTNKAYNISKPETPVTLSVRPSVNMQQSRKSKLRSAAHRPAQKVTNSRSAKPASSLQHKTEKPADKKLVKKRKRNEEQNYICDQCGRCFKNSSNFKVHLIRHTGIKNYECKECGHKEFTHHLLNLHIRVQHRGEKPYACKLCDQRFYTSTSRCRHERKHINKPLGCKHCGKTFIMTSSLKQHEFLHTGARPHRCDTCNMDFQMKTYLNTHNRSKQHLKKVQESLQPLNASANEEEFNFDDFIEEDNKL